MTVIITLATRSKEGDVPERFAKEQVWVKCRKPDCGAEYQINKKYYFEYVTEHRTGLSVPPLPCEKCEEMSIYRVVKCEKCGLIFEMGAAGPGDLADRCPECSYSKIEEGRKRAREARESK